MQNDCQLRFSAQRASAVTLASPKKTWSPSTILNSSAGTGELSELLAVVRPAAAAAVIAVRATTAHSAAICGRPAAAPSTVAVTPYSDDVVVALRGPPQRAAVVDRDAEPAESEPLGKILDSDLISGHHRRKAGR